MTNGWHPTPSETGVLLEQLREIRDWHARAARRLSERQLATESHEIELAIRLAGRIADNQRAAADVGELVGWLEKLERAHRESREGAASPAQPWTAEEILAREA